VETVYRQGNRVRRSLAGALSLDCGGVVVLVLTAFGISSAVSAGAGIVVAGAVWIIVAVRARPQPAKSKNSLCGQACASCSEAESCAVRLNAEVEARIARWDVVQLRRMGDSARYSFVLPLVLACGVIAFGPSLHHGWGWIVAAALLIGAAVFSLVTVMLAKMAST